MTRVSGPLSAFTDNPSQVSELRLYASRVRAADGWVYTHEFARYPVDVENDEEFSFDCMPGSADMRLVIDGEESAPVPIEVPRERTVSLESVVEAAERYQWPADNGERSRVGREFSPEEFGAVGDGETDDAEAIQSAIDACRDAGGGIVKFQPGVTYLVSEVFVGPGTVLEGYGSRLLRPDMMPNWTRMISNTGRHHQGDLDSTKPIVLRGLTLDGNLANQGPYDNYEQEQSSLVLFTTNGRRSGRERVIIEDMIVVGSVSDGIHIVANCEAYVHNLVAFDCFRGGLTITGGNSRIAVEGYLGGGDVRGAHLDIEVDSIGHAESWRTDVTINDWNELTTAEMSFQFTGVEGSLLNLTNAVIRSGVYIYGGTAERGPAHIRLADCEIHTKTDEFFNSIWNPIDIEFNNCTFTSSHRKSQYGLGAFHVSYNHGGTAPVESELKFIDCEWRSTEVIGEVATPAIWVDFVTENDTTRYITELRGCTISGDYDYGVFLRGGTEAVIRDVQMGARIPFSIEGAASRRTVVRSYNVEYLDTVRQSFESVGSNPIHIIEHRNVIVPEAAAGVETTRGFTRNVYQGARLIQLESESPVGLTGLVGDRAQANRRFRSNLEWVCTQSGSGTGNYAATWLQSKTGEVAE